MESRHYATPQTSVDVTWQCTRHVSRVSCEVDTEYPLDMSRYNLSEFHLSQLSLRCQDDNEERSPDDHDDDDEAVRKKKKKKKSDWKQELEEGIETLPLLGGVSIALCLGAPVYLASNIKLAMFAAIGGGIMGYTTGKMFSDWG